MYYCGGFGFWWIFPLFFGGIWLLFFTGIFLRFRRGGRGGHGWHGHDAAHVLRERFARGDIDTEEYQRRLRVLEGQ